MWCFVCQWVWILLVDSHSPLEFPNHQFQRPWLPTPSELPPLRWHPSATSLPIWPLALVSSKYSSFQSFLFWVCLMFFSSSILFCTVYQRKQHQLEPNCFAFRRPFLTWVLRMATVFVLLNHWMDQLWATTALWPGSNHFIIFFWFCSLLSHKQYLFCIFTCSIALLQRIQHLVVTWRLPRKRIRSSTLV